jgi:TolB-like protein/DNA-binding winged helix-turn-helix (wHTH) protein
VTDSRPRRFHFGEFTLDEFSYRLERGEHPLRLERLPMELLILLLQRRGELVSREEIGQRLWDEDVFVDVDHGINVAIRKVRLALRDDPEKPRFIETVVGKGYRFSGPVTRNGESGSPAQPLQPTVDAVSIPAASPPGKRIPSFPRRLGFGAAAVLAVVAVSLVVHGVAARRTGPSPIKSLAVLPLKNLSGDAAQEYFADGMTEALIGRLSLIRDLRVISRTSVMRFKDTRVSVPEIARTLRVDAIVEGSVSREGGRVRVTAQLIRAEADEHIWSEV